MLDPGSYFHIYEGVVLLSLTDPIARMLSVGNKCVCSRKQEARAPAPLYGDPSFGVVEKSDGWTKLLAPFSPLSLRVP